MTLPRRRAIAATSLALTSALALSACGSDSDSDSGSEKGGKGGTHAVDTYKGEVEVPNAPERVVVLDTAELDSAITLGANVVGATKTDVGSDFLGYVPKEKLKDVENVGTIGQPNLEKIAALKPDLILTSAIRDEKNYDKLKAIAPTVMTETTGLPWKENFQVHADALGKKAEGKKVVAAYKKHAAQVTEALGGAEKAKKIKTNVIRFYEGADTRLYGDGSYIGTVVKDAGLGRPPIVKKATEYDGLMMEISPEQVDKADTDVVFYTSYGDKKKSGETKATSSPLWKNMDAVKKGDAHRVNDDVWLLGIGYTAANMILDDIETMLTK